MRVNDRIKAKRVRLIDAEGEQIGVVSIEEARKAAEDGGLDLVEVHAAADPPVCKLMDYGKYKYKQKRKAHQARARSHVTHVKEIRLHPKTSDHDLSYRLDHAREFLDRGDKVLFSVMFKGRELAHMEAGDQILNRVAERLADTAKVETPPKRDGRRRMSILLAPR
ncbi:MAG: translation initiation factor IF-3 [Planctomycetota bacterium]